MFSIPRIISGSITIPSSHIIFQKYASIYAENAYITPKAALMKE